jgi:hypothetical protein
MALKITVSTGKQESPRTSAGLIKRTSGEEGVEKAHISVAELVATLFDEVRGTLEGEADVELQITANVEISTKDGTPAVNLDVSGESSNARTLSLKFSTKINPREKEQKESKDKEAKG